MKKLTLLALFSASLLVVGCNHTPQATIEGVITEAEGMTLYLDALGVEKITVSDSVKLKGNGTFAFRVPRPECYDFYRLRIDRELINVSIDSTETIRINAALPTMSIAYQVEGSDDNLKLKELVMKQIELQNAVRALVRNSGPEVGVTRKKIDDLVQAYKDSVRLQYIYANPGKPYAYFALFQRLGGSLIFDPVSTRDDVRAFAAVATNLDLYHPDALRTKNLHNIAIKGMASTRPARSAANDSLATALAEKVVEASLIDISLPDADGVERRLTDLKGKVVLLSFCAYAQETSAMSVLSLRELYNQYADKGFEIYQVGLDDNEHYWRMAVDNLPWVCVHDADCEWYASREGILAFRSVPASHYGVNILPTYFLINRDNEVILRIEDEKALADAIAANI
ncbi:MAG: TlpA family protein disulfide reductase [Bacteroidaceae bacterium]|nr:TlpA family protein disulfide reductase [Bacteroidaceae bacterium]